jgi:predicted nucleotidyltransferase
VDEAVRKWAQRVRESNADVLRVGYVGSYARGNWGVGSDVDLVVIVARAIRPFTERASAFDTTTLPVPADLVVYTAQEWAGMLGDGSRFAASAEADGVWVVG